MASSKVMASRSPPNPDLPRQPPTSTLNLHSDHIRGFESMNMDEILRNIYSDSDTFALDNNGEGGGSSAVECGVGGGGIRSTNGNKTVDEVWGEIVSGGACAAGAGSGGIVEPGMTLEDFLAKAGAGSEEDVRVPSSAVTMTMSPVVPSAAAAYGMESVMMNPSAVAQFSPPAVCVQNGFGVEFGNGMGAAVSRGAGGGGRGKRRAAVEEVPLDKATQQKQRRMIKNRESAARSRERKQAHTVKLESEVRDLEEENARLLKELAELEKKRYKQSHGEPNPSVGETKTSKNFAECEFLEMVDARSSYGRITIKAKFFRQSWGFSSVARGHSGNGLDGDIAFLCSFVEGGRKKKSWVKQFESNIF
ncbi:hypothetical protein OROGR_020255 [Orobanche gracilis]